MFGLPVSDVSFLSPDYRTPLKDVSSEEYFDNYFSLNSFDVVLYSKTDSFPEDMDMAELMINVVKDMAPPIDIEVYCCKEKTDLNTARSNGKSRAYRLSMSKEHTVDYITVSDGNGLSYLMNAYTW